MLLFYRTRPCIDIPTQLDRVGMKTKSFTFHGGKPPMAYQTIVVGLVPDEFARDVLALRRAFRAKFPQLRLIDSKIPPHITVVEPVAHLLTDEDLERIDGRPVDRGTVTVAGYGAFANRGGNVLYLKCECAGLMRARQDILGMFPPLISLVSASPTFHVTIARPVPHTLLVSALDFLKKSLTPDGTRFTIAKLAVYQRQTPTAPWAPTETTARLQSLSS